jgi:pSer/pThr/pTyr-binding forkhead associated (FHA) protein
MAEMKLIITAPNQQQRELQLASSASIGRSADNTIHVDDAGVARYHAMIEKRPNGFWLNDLGSTNGTLVNGAKIVAEHQLKNGDTISLGQSTAIRVAGPEGQTASSSKESLAPPSSAPTLPAADAPPPPPTPTESGVPMTYVAVAGFTVFLLIAFVGIALLILKNKKEQTAQNHTSGFVTPTPVSTRTTTDDTKTSTTPEPVKTVTISTDTATGIAGLVGRLAGQLSGKGNYVFDPEMIQAIAARTSDYRVDVTAQAREYRLEVDRAFSNAKALKPLLGHVLAMSQSRYGQSRGNGIGVWQVPPAIAQEYAQPGEDLAALNTPKRSAEIAAAHLQEITTIFSPEDFMYALACFGQPRSVAGKLNAELQAIDPNDRRDFWKQVKSGLVTRDGAEKVIRFFAAGIVGEYPASFGLTTATAFSDL